MTESRFDYVTYIRATPEKVWAALIEPEFTRRYWVETWQESEWKRGAPWKMLFADGQLVNTGEVLEIDPPRHLVLSWRCEFMPEVREEGISRLSYTLEQQGDSVKLTFAQEMAQPDTKFIQMASEGWPLVLSSLKSFLETGEPLEQTRKQPKEM